MVSTIQWLIADVSMKGKLSKGQGYRQFKKIASDTNNDDEGCAHAARRRFRKGKEHTLPAELVQPFIVVIVVDPNTLEAFFIIVPPPTYHWNDPLNESSFIGILTKITFPELCNLILKYTAPGRAVSTVWGALDNVPTAVVPPVQPVGV